MSLQKGPAGFPSCCPSSAPALKLPCIALPWLLSVFSAALGSPVDRGRTYGWMLSALAPGQHITQTQISESASRCAVLQDIGRGEQASLRQQFTNQRGVPASGTKPAPCEGLIPRAGQPTQQRTPQLALLRGFPQTGSRSPPGELTKPREGRVGGALVFC